jgi:hypothetical protein
VEWTAVPLAPPFAFSPPWMLLALVMAGKLA